MPFWKPKKKKKAVHKAKPAKSLPKYEPKPFTMIAAEVVRL